MFVLIFVFNCKPSTIETSKTEFDIQTPFTNIPEVTGYISDYENILTTEQKAELTKILSYIEHKHLLEIAIITVKESKSINQDNFNQLAFDISKKWENGKAKDHAMTIVFSKKLRRIKINVTNDASIILTDDVCEKVLNERILPNFKNDNYYIGLKNGISEFAKLYENR